MSTTVTFKLNKAANQFQAGESVGFGIRGGVQYYDRETQQKEWTNYEAVIFAKNPNQVAFYQQALAEGSIVEVSGRQQKIRQYQGANGLQLSIEILDAAIGYVGTTGQAQQAPQRQPAQQPQRQQPVQQNGFQQPTGFAPPTGQPAPRPSTIDEWADEIPDF